MINKKIVIIIPAYNEEKTIAGVIKRAKKYGSVVVIDDASKDHTNAIAKKSGVKVIRHPKNRGLGGALRTGFNHALRTKCDVIITLDADGQHRPEDIPRFLKKIEQGYDFVIGNRDLRKYPYVKKFGNFFLNIATNLVAQTNIKDTESGFRAFTKAALKKMKLKANRYEIAAEIIYEIGRNRFKTANIEIKSPVYVKGVGVTDGVKNFAYLLKQ